MIDSKKQDLILNLLHYIMVKDQRVRGVKRFEPIEQLERLFSPSLPLLRQLIKKR